jgi:hypothetical protein
MTVSLDDDKRGSPLGPDPTAPCPEKSIGSRQPRTVHRALQDAELVTERHHLKLKGYAATKRQQQGCEDGGKHGAR